MSNESPSRSSGRLSPRTLTERVRARVAEAGRAPNAKGGARPRPRRSSLASGTAERGEAHAIDRVYREMRTLYRSYRRRTKRPAVPELRQAVLDYKRGPSLPRLVAVASFLDDRRLLDW